MQLPSVLAAILGVTAVAHARVLDNEKRQAAAPTVTISAGAVVGTATQYPGTSATSNKFLGIPFAKSPPLRFGLPEAPAPWSTPLQATAYKPACYQQSNYSVTGPQSEDCLYINVFAPANTTSSSGKTVMVWFYGGDLQGGSADLATYDGSSIAANQDVIVVSFNYRISAFGFSNSPEIPISQQNVGFYDQRMALSWVQANIKAFGGDPTKVTIFGQSAGGFSIKYLLAFPPSPLPFRAAIMESEATLIIGNGQTSWNQLAASVGCTGTGQLACVRSKPAAAIEAVIQNASVPGFPPADDGVTYTANPLPRFSNHQAAQVPVILGSNGQEAAIITQDIPADSDPVTLPSVLPGLGLGLPSSLSTAPAGNLLDLVLTDFGFQCPAAMLASTLQNSGHPTWRYYYNASFADTAAFPGEGAYHTAEIPEVFGTYPYTTATAFEVSLSKYMQTAWASFAKNPTGGPASNWAEYGSAMNVANLGSNNVIEQTIPASSIDQLCPLLNTVSNLQDIVDASVPPELEQMLSLGTIDL